MTAAQAILARRHACVSFANQGTMDHAAEVCQSFMLDNGAFSVWTAGKGEVDVAAYAEWVNHWRRHPGFDFALIPDVIDGTEDDNERIKAQYRNVGGDLTYDVPVWHLHESLKRLDYLSRAYPRVALGSSGVFATVGSSEWWGRMSEAMDQICDTEGRPRCKLHGLRMLNPTIFSQLPLSSADSTNVARNIGIDAAWDRAAYAPRSKSVRALVLADRIEHHGSAATWQRTRGAQMNMELLG